MISTGIDAGSRTVKVVIFDNEEKTVLASAICDQGIHQEKIASTLIEKTCQEASIQKESIQKIVATGYGRKTIRYATKQITEITCHARGVHFLEPSAKTIIDIGGQDSKVIHLNEMGKVKDFAMNDRCAAGTGRFLENVAVQLGIDISRLGAFAGQADKPCAISSMCVVFAETEIIGLLADNKSRENIIAGVQQAIASRIHSMAGKHMHAPVIFTGGVALIPGMDSTIAKTIQKPVKVIPDPQLTGALGAAILASEL